MLVFWDELTLETSPILDECETYLYFNKNISLFGSRLFSDPLN
jgi:hypothetical protein